MVNLIKNVGGNNEQWIRYLILNPQTGNIKPFQQRKCDQTQFRAKAAHSS